jgi:hypothetical protein
MKPNLAVLLLAPLAALHAAELPQFFVPGHEANMKTLNELHALHHDDAFTDCTLWDGWLPMATLWASDKKRAQCRASFLSRRIDADGYVSMQQHRGMAHSEGWPFPAWQQSTGVGFHFSIADEVWAIQNFALQPLASTDGWEITGAEVTEIDPVAGLKLKATGDVVRVTTPAFRCGTIVAPFARLEWAARGLSPEAKPKLLWLLEGESAWKPGDAWAKSSPGFARCKARAATGPTTPGPVGVSSKAAARPAASAWTGSSSKACLSRKSCSTDSSGSARPPMASPCIRACRRTGPH